MKTSKAILLGCGIALGLALLLLLGGGLTVYHFAQDPEGMAVHLELPETVKQDDTFDLRVIVINERKKKSLKVSSVDLAEDLLSGVTVRSCDPPARSSMKIPIEGSHSYTFEKSIAPGATNIFTFHLRARRTGRFSGDVDVCEGGRFVTVLAEMEVTD